MRIPGLNIQIKGYLELLWYIIGKNTHAGKSRSLKGRVGSLFRSNKSAEASDPKPEDPSDIKISDAPPLWGLIIGINDYTHPTEKLRKLKGSVSDADAINQYLQIDLKVPPDQIVNLRNKEASRDKIIAALDDLRDNPRIQSQDPILIYYAGHGGEIPSDDGTIQTLVPVDYLHGKTSPIPDRTLAALINGIAKKHGNNITVILDCCHSGSGTRGSSEESETLARGCELGLGDVPRNLDALICAAYPGAETSSRGIRFAEGFATKGMKSHVLLAACSANELALEDKQSEEAHGRFTTALLELFRSVPPDQLTYADILTKIRRIDGQNPQCEGFHRDRILFNAKVRPPTRRCYDVRQQGKAIILEGGQAHGITNGAEFTLYSDRNVALAGEPKLGTMVAREARIKPFITVLELVGGTNVPELKATAVAIQTKAGVSEDLLIHVPMEIRYMPVFEAIALEMTGTGPNPCRIGLVEKDKAKLEIVSHGKDQFAFNVLEKRATEHGFTRMPHHVDSNTNDIHRVLRAAAHYHFHLNLNHANNLIMNKIKIEFFPLLEDWDDSGELLLSPTEGVNMYQDGRIEYEVVAETKYGMRVTNETPWDLHFACLFFDHADFGILALTEVNAQTSYEKDYHLKKDSVAEIGYGPLGIPPLECDIPEGLDLTIGFLKFYFTNQVVDLSHVPQLSPFTSTRGFKNSGMVNKKSDPVWGTVLIPHLPALHGAVNDSDALSDYLQTNLKVPADRIVNLRNQEATRAGILRALNALSLRSVRHPRKDDSIIIYFAGYGGPLDSNIGLAGVRTIVPWDYSAATGNEIPPVTSSELLSYVAAIKRNKGDRITIIFDCGGSSQRVQEEQDGPILSRVIDIASGESTHEGELVSEKSVLAGNVFILSACSKGEAAREAQGHGLFTSALIKQLKRQGLVNTTRSNVLANLPQIPSQTPQAYGGIANTPLFDTGLVPPEQIAYNISEDRQRYVVHAGSVAGITPGAHFSVYRDRTRLAKKKPKVFIADRVALFTTTLKPLVDQPLKPLLNSPSAIPSGPGHQTDLVVAVPPKLKDALTPFYQIALKLLYNTAAESYQVLFTEDKETADIFVDVSKNSKELFTVTVLDQRVSRHGYTDLSAPLPLKLEDIERFLRSAAHFYRHLNLSYLNTAIGESVSVEFLKLVDSDTEYDDDGHPYRYPVDNNLAATGLVEVQVDPEEPEDFGFRFINNSDSDLYPHIFYFDNSDLSIANYYPRGSKEVPIKKNGGVLTIGFDNPGTPAYSYFIRDGQDLDVGLIKVLFSKEPAALSSIPQNAIFEEAPVSGGGKMKVVEGKTDVPSMTRPSEKDLETIWGSVMFCIVQHRVLEDE
ncbi:hypothetical protein EST38_g8799 [Candolleomyces aberdarensis]|uniref:Peptidase C14 caspase domain-containing protein n=1 Tax=Candolleomyces aberdarensis TaxID=2316362 RepID=A0A4V1Q319_9AGAR|nr:hypothetical protein EST38_g8799 [Candolleomyces aberdarensis]